MTKRDRSAVKRIYTVFMAVVLILTSVMLGCFVKYIYKYRVQSNYRPDDGPGDDAYEIRQGNISITPLISEFTDERALDGIEFLNDMEI